MPVFFFFLLLADEHRVFLEGSRFFFATPLRPTEERTKRNRLLADDKEKNVGMRAAVASLCASGHAEFARVRFPRPGMPPTWLKLPDSFGTGARRLLARWAPFSPRARRRGGDARNLDAFVRCCCCCYGGVGAMFEAAPPFSVFVVPPPPAGWVRRGMAAGGCAQQRTRACSFARGHCSATSRCSTERRRPAAPVS